MLATADRVTVSPDLTTFDALTYLAEKLTDALHANILAISETDDPDPVHKSRVALRRFRAAIHAFAPVLDDDLADALQDRSRSLFRLLGAMRDADVLATRFAGTDRAEAMQTEAAAQRQKGRRLLKKKKASLFRDWVLRRLASKSARRGGKKAKALRAAPVADIARPALDRAWATCLSNGPDLHRMSARAQHDLRKDLKMLRYLSEFFADLWPGPAQDAFLDDLRALQDDLGELTDVAMARALGHADVTDTSTPQSRAADGWGALVLRGPWWA